MDNKATRDFVVSFDELNTDNQNYIIAIQQALAFAQSAEKAAKENALSTTKLEYPKELPLQ